MTNYVILFFFFFSNPFMTSPSHIEVILTEKEETVAKAADKKVARLNKRQLARNARLARA